MSDVYGSLKVSIKDYSPSEGKGTLFQIESNIVCDGSQAQSITDWMCRVLRFEAEEGSVQLRLSIR